MNVDRLNDILNEVSGQFRKGPEREDREAAGGVQVTELYFMPPSSEARDDLEMVDLVFVDIGVDKAKAESHRDELIAILDTWPQPDMLAGGPSYITAGGILGDQGMALQLFAVGQVLGLWSIISGLTMGFSQEKARDMAGSGAIWISGYHPKKQEA